MSKRASLLVDITVVACVYVILALLPRNHTITHRPPIGLVYNFDTTPAGTNSNVTAILEIGTNGNSVSIWSLPVKITITNNTARIETITNLPAWLLTNTLRVKPERIR